MSTLRAVVLSGDVSLCEHVTGLLAPHAEVLMVRVLKECLEREDLKLFLRMYAPDVILLDFLPAEAAIAMAAGVLEFAPGVQVIGLHPGGDAEEIIAILRCGVRELLNPPLDPAALNAALGRAKEALRRLPPLYPPPGDLYCFVPAKGGVGASTVALNTAAALARLEGTSPLLADFDLNCGMVRLMLGLHNVFATTDAVESADQLNVAAWRQMVSSLDGLDVLHAGTPAPDRRMDRRRVALLMDLLKRLYSHVLVDLSPGLESYALQIMNEARAVFLVSTLEVHSLYLAREKRAFLSQYTFGDRVYLALNRTNSSAPIAPDQAERTVGAPLAAQIANDYSEVQASLADGRPAAPHSVLGRSVHDFAERLGRGVLSLSAAKPGGRTDVQPDSPDHGHGASA